MSTLIVHRSPTRSTLKSVPRLSSTSGTKLLDDAAAESLNALGDRLAASIGALEQAVGIINEASYSDRRWDDRARARLLLSRVLTDVAQVNVELARPLPSFRSDVGTYRPTVRSRYRGDEVEVVEDICSMPMPARVMRVVR
jgi:hypothetical protein